MNEFTSVITKRLDIKDTQVKEFTSVLESNKNLSTQYDDKFLNKYSTMINNPQILEQYDITHILMSMLI